MSFRAAVTLDRAVVACGDTVTGTAEWSGNTLRHPVDVVLRYWTQGRGDSTAAVAATCPVGDGGGDSHGRAQFRLEVPSGGPVSYDGRLLRLLWDVEVHAPAGGATHPRTANLTVVPRGLPRPAPPDTHGYPRHGLPLNPFALGLEGTDLVDRGLPPPPSPGQQRLVQVIGISGGGKSTTLRRWHATAPGPWHYVPPGPVGRLRRLPVAPLVYWDEANRAPRPLRRDGLRRAARLGATVVAGTHDDLGAEARAAGLAVDTVELPPISAADLTAWAARRFAAVGSPGWSLPPSVAVDVAARADRSWWVAGDLLHEWIATEVAGDRP